MSVNETFLVSSEPAASFAGETPLAESAVPGKNRQRLPVYVIAGIILVCALIGFAWWLYARQFVTTDDAFIEGNITIVAPKISAHVAKVHVRDNQFVRKGDLLIEFEARELEAKLEQAKAQLQTALASRTKAQTNVALTRSTSRADLNQASSNLQTARTNVEQTRLASATKQNVIEQARARASAARTNLEQMRAQIPAAEAGLAQAEAQVDAAETRAANARLDYERNRELHGAGIVSRQTLEQAANEHSQARATLIATEKQVEIARSRLNALHRQIEAERARLRESEVGVTVAENDFRRSLAEINSVSSQADESAGRLEKANLLPELVALEQSEVDVAEAQIAQAQAAVTQAELELSYARIYAPQDGYIARRAVQEGQLVQPDQALLAVTQPEVWVVANFKETQIEKIRAGQAVDIYVDAYPGVVFSGKVDSFQAGTGSRFSVLPAENASGNFVKVVQRIPVKLVFDQTPDSGKYLLVPGMSVVPKVRVR